MRVATTSLQQTLLAGIAQAQQGLNASEAQLASGKKVQTIADLGVNAVADLSAHSMLSQQQSYQTACSSLGTTLSLYDTNISDIDQMGSTLKQAITNAIGTNNGAGLSDAITNAFGQFASAMNASEAGVPLFGGGVTTTSPFKPATLADLTNIDPSQAFANGSTKATARLGDNISMHYGVTASDLGTAMTATFKTLSSLGTIGDKPTAAQLQTLQKATSQIDAALSQVREVNAQNGSNQTQVDTLNTRALDRSTMLKGVISNNEDADMGQVATDIARQQAMLQASYSVFAKLSTLSLSSYLS